MEGWREYFVIGLIIGAVLAQITIRMVKRWRKS